jgi:hypothetical protein
MGYQQINAATLASATLLTVPAGATVAIFRLETGAVHYRDDGTAPTSSLGMMMTVSDPPYEYWATLDAIQFIAASGSPILDILYYRITG